MKDFGGSEDEREANRGEGIERPHLKPINDQLDKQH
jgi:hypothetical protein